MAPGSGFSSVPGHVRVAPDAGRKAIMAIKVCVFDAYGTLFDVAAAARVAASSARETAEATRREHSSCACSLASRPCTREAITL